MHGRKKSSTNWPMHICCSSYNAAMSNTNFTQKNQNLLRGDGFPLPFANIDFFQQNLKRDVANYPACDLIIFFFNIFCISSCVFSFKDLELYKTACLADRDCFPYKTCPTAADTYSDWHICLELIDFSDCLVYSVGIAGIKQFLITRFV